jgi:hypothetical protein
VDVEMAGRIAAVFEAALNHGVVDLYDLFVQICVEHMKLGKHGQ